MENNRVYGKNKVVMDHPKSRQLYKWNTNKNNNPTKIKFSLVWVPSTVVLCSLRPWGFAFSLIHRSLRTFDSNGNWFHQSKKSDSGYRPLMRLQKINMGETSLLHFYSQLP